MNEETAASRPAATVSKFNHATIGRQARGIGSNYADVESELLLLVKPDDLCQQSGERKMATRTYPSYFMYKDAQKQWRWRYDASNYKTIAVSSESYHNRADCQRGIDIMKASTNSEVWFPTELVNAA